MRSWTFAWGGGREDDWGAVIMWMLNQRSYSASLRNDLAFALDLAGVSSRSLRKTAFGSIFCHRRRGYALNRVSISFRQLRCVGHQSRPLFIIQRHFERMADALLLQCSQPARAIGAQIGASTGLFSCRVDEHLAICSPHQAHQLTLAIGFLAGDARTLRLPFDMSVRHRSPRAAEGRYSSPQESQSPERPRLRRLRATTCPSLSSNSR